ncbi:hypothetical protein JCM21900_002404, partial [Sporobolomyces salmonicolor]
MVPFPPRPLTAAQRATLISNALEARNGSYSPYSKFRVGACLLAEDGSYVSGANVESASYGGTICAERTAIVKGVSEGKRKYVGLAVTRCAPFASGAFARWFLTSSGAASPSDLVTAITPCGICRQVLREFCPLDMPILLVPASYAE